MDVYADYKYYSNVYGGSTVPESSFLRYAMKAARYIDSFTFQQAEKDVPLIQCASCELTEMLYDREQNAQDGKEVTSENTDGYSVSYVAEGVAGQTVEDVEKLKAGSIIRLYLSGTKYLYRGLDHDD